MADDASESLGLPPGPLETLGLNSYTVHRLHHATPEHLDITTRRCFIGPIPQGWLKSHRRDWYKHHLKIHYSSRTPSFSASPQTGKHRALTGIDGPSLTAAHRLAFPQPDDLEDERDAGDDSPAEPVDRTSLSVVAAESSADVELGGASASKAAQLGKKSALKKQENLGVKAQKRAAKLQTSGAAETVASGVQSFYTAKENQLADDQSSNNPSGTSKALDRSPQEERRVSQGSPSTGPASHTGTESPLLGQKSSTSSLPRRQLSSAHESHTATGEGPQASQGAPADVQDADEPAQQPATRAQGDDTQKKRKDSGLVRFHMPDEEAERDVKVKLAQSRRDTLRRRARSRLQDGEILKMEKMLVRIEFTSHSLNEDFDENDWQRVEPRTLEKWKEFIVVCRALQDDDIGFALQMYKSRVIPAVDRSRRHRVAHEIYLDRRNTKVSLYSSLDKTIAIWFPYKKGTRMYIMRPRAAADSMEWYTFIRRVLGWQRSYMLQVDVPDLSVSLRLNRPFATLENAESIAKAAEGDEAAMLQTMKDEQEAAGTLIRRCMDQLEKTPEWREIVEAWANPVPAGQKEDALAQIQNIIRDAKERAKEYRKSGHLLPPSESDDRGSKQPNSLYRPVGLAWKRYDRLEWVHGANEKKMYGTIAMEKSHILELRPKQHYPTEVIHGKGKRLIEPAPVEGFLIRLTSQKGTEQRLGKLFFKRLYFSTHNHLLVFNRPTQADPPPPPKLPTPTDPTKIPSSSEILNSTPLIYSVNPFPVRGGNIRWLAEDESQVSGNVVKRDQEAYDENERKLDLLLNCDGCIDMTNMVKVRRAVRGAASVDDHIGDGADVDFDQEVEDSHLDDGTTRDMEFDRTFEVVLLNGLVLRLQAFDSTTRNEWIRRLQDLVKYWKLRRAADIALYKMVRQENLHRFNIDSEEMESTIGQFGKKWEVSHSFASPELYHMCGISCCRSVHMAGFLYRKPRMHANFSQNLVVLSHGHLLIFRDAVRRTTGAVVPHIHHERIASLDLSDCYVYSGFMTENDLLYTTRSFDRSRPGRQALPRMYAQDGWTSMDEDVMTCFVIWHGRKKSWFRSDTTQNTTVQDRLASARVGSENAKGAKRQKLKHMSKLGVQGRSVVFKARSRAERDHWVMNIAMEIERLAINGEDVRVVGDQKRQ